MGKLCIVGVLSGLLLGCASLDSDNPTLKLKAISECRSSEFGIRFEDFEDVEEYKETSRKLECIASNRRERADVRKAAFVKLFERDETEACARIVLNAENETNEFLVASFVALSSRSFCLLLTMHTDAGIGMIKKVRPALASTGRGAIDIWFVAQSLNRCLSADDAISSERARSLIIAIDALDDWASVYAEMVNLHVYADGNAVKLCMQRLFSRHRDEALGVLARHALNHGGFNNGGFNKSVRISFDWLLERKLTQQEIADAIGMLAEREMSQNQESILRRFCEKCQDQEKLKKLALSCEVLYDYILDEGLIANYAMRASRDCTKIVNRIEDQEVLLKMSLEARDGLTRDSAVKRLDMKNLIVYENKMWIAKYRGKFYPRGWAWNEKLAWNELCEPNVDFMKRILKMQETDSDRRIAERIFLEKTCERIKNYKNNHDKKAIDTLIYLAEADAEGARIAGVRLLDRYSGRVKELVVKWATDIANDTASTYCGEFRLRLARILCEAEPEQAKEWYSKAVDIGYPRDEKLLSKINEHCEKEKYAEVIRRNLWKGDKVGCRQGYEALRWGSRIDPEMQYVVEDDGKKYVDVKDNSVNFVFRSCRLIYSDKGFSGVEWTGSPFLGGKNLITGAVNYRVREMMREGFDGACEHAEREWGVNLTKTHMNHRLAALGSNGSVVVVIAVPDDPDESARYLVLKK